MTHEIAFQDTMDWASPISVLLDKAGFWTERTRSLEEDGPSPALAFWLVDTLRPSAVVGLGPQSVTFTMQCQAANDVLRHNGICIANEDVSVDLTDLEPQSVGLLALDIRCIDWSNAEAVETVLTSLSDRSVLVLTGLQPDQDPSVDSQPGGSSNNPNLANQAIAALSDYLPCLPRDATDGLALFIAGSQDGHPLDGFETLTFDAPGYSVFRDLIMPATPVADLSTGPDSTGPDAGGADTPDEAAPADLEHMEQALREAQDSGAEMIGDLMDELDQMKKRMRFKTLEDARKSVEIKLRQLLIQRLRARPRILLQRGPTPQQRLEAKRVAASKQFDAAWYTKRYTDVKGSGMDPALHFVVTGLYEGRSPSKAFDPLVYYFRNPKALETRTNPLTGSVGVL